MGFVLFVGFTADMVGFNISMTPPLRNTIVLSVEIILHTHYNLTECRHWI